MDVVKRVSFLWCTIFMHNAGERCLRAGPKNSTNGFFVAVFVRKDVNTDIVATTLNPGITTICVGQCTKGTKQRKRAKKRCRMGYRRKRPITLS